MKSKLNNKARGCRTGLLCILSGTSIGLSQEVEVDTELLLLVDVSGSVDSSEYSLMMDGYQNAFRSSSVLDAIQAGPMGAIAASVVFWSGSAQQAVGVGWTMINDVASANSFADAIAQTTRPFSGMTAIGSGIDYGAGFFGSETGGVDNGFSSVAQIIDVSGDGTDNNTPPDSQDRAANVRASRDAALAAGVDMINGLPIGNAGGALEQYYIDNVIGGSAGGVDAFTQAATSFGDVEQTLVLKLQREVTAGGVEAAAAVPEPQTALVSLLGVAMLAVRRR